MATVTAGNSTAVTVAGDQTVSVSVNHNNSGRIVFTPTNASAINGDGGTGVSFGPTAMSKTYGPFNVAGTLTIYCDVGTVTYTVNDSYFPNQVGIGTTSPSAPLDVRGAAGVILGQFLETTSGNNRRIRFSVSSNVATIESIASTGATNMAFNVDSSERMRIDSNGNLGVGTTPSAWQSAYKGAQLNNRSAIVGNTNGATLIGNNWYNDGTNKYIATDFAALYSQLTGQHIWYVAASGTADTAITFTQAMTLNASGNLLVGTTSAYGGPGRINVGFDQASNFGITMRNTNATATGVFVSFENSGGTGNGSISQTNSTTVAYNTSSDRRLKTNIAPAPEAGADIDAIAIVSHGWVSNDDTVKYGVVAQDLALVAPEAVTAGDDGEEIERAWGVDYSKLVPMLVKEVQSLRARVAQLEGA